LAAEGREIWWVSGTGAASLEEGGVLEGEETIWEGTVKVLNTKRFLPAQWWEKEYHWQGWRWRAPGEGVEAASQDVEPAKTFLGLRGPWGDERRGGRWSREGSGVVGPTGRAGGSVEVTVEGMWPGGAGAAEEQTLEVAGPWGGPPGKMAFSTSPEWVERSVTLRVPEGAEGMAGEGVYRFRAAHPWNPGAHGMRGYDGDLGILVRRVRIRAGGQP